MCWGLLECSQRDPEKPLRHEDAESGLLDAVGAVNQGSRALHHFLSAWYWYKDKLNDSCQTIRWRPRLTFIRLFSDPEWYMHYHFMCLKIIQFSCKINITAFFFLQDTFTHLFLPNRFQITNLPSFLASLASFLASTITKPMFLCSRTWATSWRQIGRGSEWVKGRVMVEAVPSIRASTLCTSCYSDLWWVSRMLRIWARG